MYMNKKATKHFDRWSIDSTKKNVWKNDENPI